MILPCFRSLTSTDRPAEREKATESVVNWSSVRSVVLVMGSTFDVPRVFALLSWVSCSDEDDNNNSIMLRDD